MLKDIFKRLYWRMMYATGRATPPNYAEIVKATLRSQSGPLADNVVANNALLRRKKPA